MRTTLSLDNDVNKLLEDEVRRSGESMKTTVNQLLRLALALSHQPNSKQFEVTPRPLGLPTGLNYDNVEELVSALEGDTHK